MVFKEGNLVEYFGSDSNADLTIPSFCTKIPESLFASKTIRSINFESGIISMEFEDSAFSQCTLTVITFPACLTKIGKKCFYQCPNLIQINFSNTLVSTIESETFSECSSLSKVIFDYSEITTIKEYSFKNDVKLATIEISESNVQTIGIQAFYKTGITEIEFPVTINQIDESCFNSNSNLKKVVIPPDAPIEELEKFTFENCIKLEEFVINDNNRIIKDYCFSNCPLLKTFSLGKNTTNIGMYAFKDCVQLTTIIIPDESNLTRIMPFAFSGCTLLTRINVSENNNRFAFDEPMLLDADRTTIIYYLPTSKKNTIIIPYSIQTINDYAFHSCQNLQEVLFSEGNLKSIGYQSFMNCTRLSRVIFPTSLEIIQSKAFSLCDHLQCGCFEIPSNVRAKTSIKWDEIGVKSHLYGDYCLSKKCYISHIRVTCQSQNTHNQFIYSLIMIFSHSR